MTVPPPLSLATLAQHMVEVQGTPPGQPYRRGGEVDVTLSPFALCRFPVTQQLYQEVMGINPSYFPGAQRPVETVSSYDAIEFCNQLSVQQGLTPCYQIDKERKDPQNESNYDKFKWTVTFDPQANGYRLPTEAEWEYAAAGGRYASDTEYAGSDQLDEVGWYGGNSLSETQPVGRKRPNALGLYDLSGNVWEWCWDRRASYPSEPQTDPTGPRSGAGRVFRGGSWRYDAAYSRVASRSLNLPGFRSHNLGFRLARSL